MVADSTFVKSLLNVMAPLTHLTSHHQFPSVFPPTIQQITLGQYHTFCWKNHPLHRMLGQLRKLTPDHIFKLKTFILIINLFLTVV